jgi:hypothetical protein
MRSALFGLGLASGLLLAGLTARPAFSSEDGPIDMAKVPAAVKKAAEKAVPGGKLTKAATETEDGKTIYELSGTDAKGHEVDVSLTAEAVVIEVETVIPMSEVPKVVSDALKAKAKEITISKAETVTKEGKITAYEFAGKNAAGKSVEVSVTPDGKTVKVE